MDIMVSIVSSNISLQKDPNQQISKLVGITGCKLLLLQVAITEKARKACELANAGSQRVLIAGGCRLQLD